ncbi:hypothetical protein NQ314_008745 [Rhamnusium bicolor]|uniref:PiggyBac transposable element-derived protein domain-containing protein n=1 Tax=Rhamnusium bicolor TaxID=1586634 RepID=A0AAV8Y954_9CUCU|nr:hypothetical protein NQ314_008745 [Rhamnusium bicolor]
MYKPGERFELTNIIEIKLFIVINLLMGINTSPSYRDYWSSRPELRDTYIISLMNVNGFGFLLSNIHLNDNTLMPKKRTTGLC